MQFSLVALSAVLATGVYASPEPLSLRQDTCEIADCLLDLAPSAVACASAAAQGGTDPVSDTNCLIDAAKDVVEGLPASCNGCLAELGINLPALSGVVGTIEGGLEPAGSAIESGLSSLGDIFN